jgi:hypothetical protein
MEEEEFWNLTARLGATYWCEASSAGRDIRSRETCPPVRTSADDSFMVPRNVSAAILQGAAASRLRTSALSIRPSGRL